jgi:hypothetical protein
MFSSRFSSKRKAGDGRQGSDAPWHCVCMIDMYMYDHRTHNTIGQDAHLNSIDN